MRLFKSGELKTKGIFGVRVLIIDIVNPLKQVAEALEPILWLRRSGYLRSLRLPGIKIQWLRRGE